MTTKTRSLKRPARSLPALSLPALSLSKGSKGSKGPKGPKASNGKKELVIDGLLKKLLNDVEQVAPHRWRIPLSSNGTAVVGEARLEDEWLVFEATPRPARRAKPWDLLRRNAGLAGLAKFAVRPGGRSPHLLAEIPLDETIDLAGVARTTLAGMVEGLGLESRRGGHGHDAETGGDFAIDLAGLCAEAGFPATTRTKGGVTLTLPADRKALSATVHNGNGLGPRAAVVLATCGSMSDRSRRALAVLLLTACSSVRHARAAIDGDEDDPQAGFEVRLSGAPVAAELEHALSALTVACDLCGPEAQATQDQAVACRFLKVRG